MGDLFLSIRRSLEAAARVILIVSKDTAKHAFSPRVAMRPHFGSVSQTFAKAGVAATDLSLALKRIEEDATLSTAHTTRTTNASRKLRTGSQVGVHPQLALTTYGDRRRKWVVTRGVKEQIAPR